MLPAGDIRRLGAGWSIARALTTGVCLAGAYYLIAVGEMAAAIPPGRGIPLWAPIGFALALLLRYGWRMLPGLLLGVLAVDLAYFPWTIGVIIAASTGLGLAATLTVLRWAGVTGHFPDTARAALRLAGGSAVTLALPPSIGVPVRVAAGLIQPDAAWATWWRWWLGDVSAALIVAPALLAWLDPPRANRGAGTAAEGVALFALAMGAGAVRAWLGVDRWVQDAAYLSLALALWAAFRFSPRMVTVTVITLTGGMMAGAVVAASAAHAPITDGGLAALQVFFVVLGSMSLILSATVTERRAAERALRDSHEALDRTVRERTAALAEANARLEARLADLRRAQFSIDRAAFPIIWFERDGRLVYLNDAAAALAGGDPARYRDHYLWDIEPNLTPAGWQTLLEALERDDIVRHEAPVRRSDGSPAIVEFTASYVELDERALVVVYAVDSTETHRVKDQLREAQKLEALGTLAGGIAHDFNNLLSGILGFAGVVVAESPAGSPVQAAGRTIEQAAHRAAELTRQLLGYARRGKVRQAPVDVHAVVTGAVAITSRIIDRAIVVQTDLCEGSPTLVGDAGQVEQVLLNLIVNARDAMPYGGRLLVRTHCATLDDAYCRAHVDATPGPHVAVSVTDTGTGIPASVRDHIFEPFFTTKPEGQGTGMGLPMVYGIVRNHGGHITVDSQEGEGSTFTTWWPLAEAAVIARDEAPPTPTAGHGHVVVVDDEPVVRQMARRLLERLGYTVSLAATGDEAMTLIRQSPDAVVLLDMVMPGLDGRETFLALRTVVPAVRVVVSSGFSLDGRAQELLDLGARAFLQKPYTLQQLSEVIAAARA